jgi:hypothetical protein
MEETSYKKARKLFSEEEQNKFAARLIEWEKVNPQIAENFDREHFLPENEMRELMDFILQKGIPVGDKKTDLQNKWIYSGNGLQLKGGEIKVSPKRIGFAIPEDKYIDILQKQNYRKFGKPEQIDEFFTDIQSSDAVTIIKEKYADCKAITFKDEKCLLWITWDNHGDNPFPFLHSSDNEYPDRYKSTCQEVRIALALDKSYKPDVLLFFVDVDKLDNQDAQVLFRPTFCDADFGEDFRPTPINFIDHGLTWQLGEPYSEEDHPKKGRPEAVVRSRNVILGIIERMILLNK